MYCNIQTYICIQPFISSLPLVLRHFVLSLKDELEIRFDRCDIKKHYPPPHDWWGCGRGFDHQLSIYKIDPTFLTALKNQPSRRPGESILGRGPKTRAPRCEGEMRHTVHWVKNIACRTGATDGRWMQIPLLFPRGSPSRSMKRSATMDE